MYRASVNKVSEERITAEAELMAKKHWREISKNSQPITREAFVTDIKESLRKWYAILQNAAVKSKSNKEATK
jgi:hypothetical protein